MGPPLIVAGHIIGGPLVTFFYDGKTGVFAFPVLGGLISLFVQNELREKLKEENRVYWFSAVRIFEDIPQTIIAIFFVVQHESDDVWALFSVTVSVIEILVWIVRVILFPAGKACVSTTGACLKWLEE